MTTEDDGGRVFVVVLCMQVASGRGVVAAVERTNEGKPQVGIVSARSHEVRERRRSRRSEQRYQQSFEMLLPTLQ